MHNDTTMDFDQSMVSGINMTQVTMSAGNMTANIRAT